MIQVIDADIMQTSADVLAHQVNCRGVMGSGVAAQVRSVYPEVYRRYRSLCEANKPSALLGLAQKVMTEDPASKHKAVVNLFGQCGYGRDVQQTDYEALRWSLHELAQYMYPRFYTVVLPYKLGCGRGGGDWDVVYQLIEKELKDFDVIICKKDMG